MGALLLTVSLFVGQFTVARSVLRLMIIIKHHVYDALVEMTVEFINLNCLSVCIR